MITTTYSCDHCKKTQDNAAQMWWIKLSCSSSQYSTDSYLRKEELWCRECCDKYNLVIDPPKSGPPSPQPTFEDTLREIIREEINASH